MISHHSQFTFTTHLTTQQVWDLFSDPVFWSQSWKASTFTSSAEPLLQLTSTVRLSPLPISATLVRLHQDFPHHLTFSLRVFSHQIDLHYALNTLENGTQIVLRVFYPKLTHQHRACRYLAKKTVRSHWQTLQQQLSSAYQEQLFTSLQTEIPAASLTSVHAKPAAASQTETSEIEAHTIAAADMQAQATVVLPMSSTPTDRATESSSTHSPPNSFTLPSLGFIFWRLSAQWQRASRPIFAQEKLTNSRWLLLYSLVELSAQHPYLTGAQLSELTGMNRVLISDIVPVLVEKHYLRKIKHPLNRKEYQLQVTAAGKTAAFAVFAKLQALEKELYPPEIEAVAPLLQQLDAVLD